MWLVRIIGLLGLLGFTLSYEKVQRAVEPSTGKWSLLVPLAVDIGIAAFTGLDLLMARLNMRTKWLRLVPWGLTGVTVTLNVAGESTLVGQVTHAAMPLLWVVAVEAGAHVIRVQVGLLNTERMDRIRGSRWLLAPFSTARLWRRMVLWEIRSYPEALGRLQDQMLALGDLQDTYGWLMWRVRAPRRERTLYKLGRLAPQHALPAEAEAEPEPEPAEPTPNPERATSKPRQNGDLRSDARLVYRQLHDERGSVPQRPFRERLRAKGYKLGNERGNRLHEEIEAELAAGG